MSDRCKLTSLPALAAVFLLMWVTSAYGQLVGRPIGDDPAYWWTLTDEITPEQLRTELQSRERSRERLRAAIEAGLHREVPEARFAELGFFIQGRLTPQLVPMWEAFNTWAARLDYVPGWEDTLRRHAGECGLSASGAGQVMSVSRDHNLRTARIMDRLGDKASRFFAEVLRPAQERLGRAEGSRVAKNRDYGRLAAIAGKRAAEVADLHQAWSTDPAAEASLESIQELREILSDADWTALRACLLNTTARDYHRHHFGPEAFQ